MACSNDSRASACSIHPYASLIFLGTVMEVTAEAPNDTGFPISDVRFRVDEAFKGTSAGDLRTIRAVQAGNCCGAPPNYIEGSQFLLFILRDEETPLIGACDPVIPVAEASDHLTYLRNLLAHNVATEVHGSVYVWKHFWAANSESEPLSGMRVTFKSEDRTFDATTDEQGKFRRNLPPGVYELGTATPGYMDRSGDMGFELASESCAEVSVSIEYNGIIEGRAVDGRGNPAPNVAVSLLDPTADDNEINFSWTDPDGRFSLRGIAPGDYVLGFNVGPLPDKSSPYAATFYPSVGRREAAGTIHLEPGQEVKLADIATSTDQCAIDVRVTDGTGKPVSGATLSAAVLDGDHFFVLYDPEIVRNGRALVPSWGHGQLRIYANLEIGGGRLQSEPHPVQVCSKRPVILKLNHRYEDPVPERSEKSTLPPAK